MAGLYVEDGDGPVVHPDSKDIGAVRRKVDRRDSRLGLERPQRVPRVLEAPERDEADGRRGRVGAGLERVVSVADREQVALLAVPGHARHLDALRQRALPLPQQLYARHAVRAKIRQVLQQGVRGWRGENQV